MYFYTKVLILLGAVFVACGHKGCCKNKYNEDNSCKYLLETILDVKWKVNDLCERLNATEEQLAGLQEYVDSQLNMVHDKIEEAIEEAAEGYVQKYDLDQDNWTLVFLATAGNGKNVYNAWTNGVDVTTVKPTNLKRTVNMHYRDSTAVTQWDNEPSIISEVKFSLFEDEKEAAFIIFDASGTDRNTWFEKTHVTGGSWPTLLDSSPVYNYFSAEGHPEAQRRFFNNLGPTYTGCPNDSGYTTVVDTGIATVNLCRWDKQPTKPQFLYSKQNGPCRYDLNNHGLADFMGISIRYTQP